MLSKMARSPFWSLVFIFELVIFYFLITLIEQQPLKSVLTSILGLIIFVSFIIWILSIRAYNKQNPTKKISMLSVIPVEFRDDDEGMEWLTNRATRKVYVFFYNALPAAFILLIFFPQVEWLPIMIILLLAICQFLIFWLEIKKANS
jgi:hypothetical protein